jgi:hypothetical protein
LPEPAATESRITRIEVRVRVGDNLLAASDDPFFLGLTGPCGREFRLLLAHGRSLRRKAEDRFVLAALGDPDANVAAPELNDPTRPSLAVSGVTGVYLRKNLSPIPNVRGVGELDDRLELLEAEVTIHGGAGERLRFHRDGPLWLGLNAGLRIELARQDARG